MVLLKLAVCLLLIIAFAEVKGQETLGFPVNTLAVVGETAKLACRNDKTRSCSQIRWQKRMSGQLSNISDGNRVYDTTKYRLNNKSLCDLVITSVLLTDSGTFICTISGSNSGSAELIVLEANSSCSSTCENDKTAENKTVYFKCMLAYRGGGSGPVMTWWNKVTGFEVQAGPHGKPDGRTVSRDFPWKSVVPGYDPLVCLTRFHFAETNVKASNFLDVRCETKECNITYPVRDVEIMPVGYASPGELITCKAEGNPPPTFEWQWKEDGEDGEWEDVPEATSETFEAFLVNGTSTQFRCVAKNKVNGIEHSDESDEVTVSKYGALIRIGITVGVIAAVLLVAGIAGLVHKFCLSE